MYGPDEQDYTDLLNYVRWVAHKSTSVDDCASHVGVIQAAIAHINDVRNMAKALLAKIEARE